MNFGLFDMIAAFFLGLFIGGVFGFFSFSLCESMKIIEEIFKDFRDVEEMVESPDDIVALKKQIKYCKNPMEIKALNKRLNDAYKKKNKKR